MRADLVGLKCVCDEIARAIKSAESSAIFLLVGDIGAGKTTLVREFAKRIGIKDSVTSPTFSLLHIYNVGNSSLGLHSADLVNFGHCADFSLALRPKFTKNHKSQTENPSVVDSARNAQNLGENSEKFAESNLDSAESQNLNKKELCEAPENSPASWCKKSGEASSSASADFLLEAEKRGSPPKSEKAAAFWRVGGAGRGVQPFLREETSEIDGEENAESRLDSANSQNLTLFPTIYHYDLFNRNLSELLDLGLLDLLSENGIHFVEWGDRRLFEIIKDAFENIFILQITKAKNDRIYTLKREF